MKAFIGEGGIYLNDVKRKAPQKTKISKEKIKEAISILDVAERFSPKINTRTKRPQIICPFHSDKNLGSCRIYTDSNTFKCEACGAHGDTLALASGYLDIPLNSMDNLLERIVSEFGLIRENVCDHCTSWDYYRGKRVPDRLSSEEYKRLLLDDHYSVPAEFEQIEYEKDEWDYVPCRYTQYYYRSLALQDPEFHDWVVCTVSRKYWLRYASMLLFCQSQGYVLMEDVIQKTMDDSIRLLRKGLMDKRLFRKELKLRNILLNEQIEESLRTARNRSDSGRSAV